MKADRRFLMPWDTPVNYTERMRRRWLRSQRTTGLLNGTSADRMLKGYVRYLDGSRSMDMPLGNALSYLELFGGRLCYATRESDISSTHYYHHMGNGFARWLRSLESIAADRRRQPLKDGSIKRVKLPAIGAIYGRRPEARSLIAIASGGRDVAAASIERQPPPASITTPGDGGGDPAGDDHPRWEDDVQAMAYLRSQGYRMDRAYGLHPPGYRKPTPKELSAANYLFDEWDWGSIVLTSCTPPQNLQ